MRGNLAQSGFTLIELVLVMFIIALLSGILAPALIRFTAGRAVENYARQIVGAARYAHAQSISEGRIYHLNFDQNAGQIWLTADSGGGNFTPPSGDFNRRFTVPDGVRMQVAQNTTTPAPVVLLPLPANITPQQFQQPSQLLDGQSSGNGSIWIYPQNATFFEFQPSGRTDPASVSLTDGSGHNVQVVCDSPTGMFRIPGRHNEQ